MSRQERNLENKKAPLRRIRTSPPTPAELREGQSVIVSNTLGVEEYTKVNGALYKTKLIPASKHLTPLQKESEITDSTIIKSYYGSYTQGNSTGYLQFDNGLIWNFGSKAFTGNTTTDTFSKAFSSKIIWLIGSGDLSYGTNGVAGWSSLTAIALAKSNTLSRTVYWQALGI